MFTVAFWKAAGERAIKTFAQAFVALLVGSAAGIVGTDWLAALNVAAMAAVVSVLTSVASGGIGADGPSLGTETLTPAVAAKQSETSPTGTVAGPAADVPVGDPVTVDPVFDTFGAPVARVQDVVDEALAQPIPAEPLDAPNEDYEDKRDDQHRPSGYWGGV